MAGPLFLYPTPDLRPPTSDLRPPTSDLRPPTSGLLWYVSTVNLRAVFPPMPTPFKDGEVDPAAIQGNVRRWITAGLGGNTPFGPHRQPPPPYHQQIDLLPQQGRPA